MYNLSLKHSRAATHNTAPTTTGKMLQLGINTTRLVQARLRKEGVSLPRQALVSMLGMLGPRGRQLLVCPVGRDVDETSTL